MPRFGSYVVPLPVVGATSPIRPDSPHGQRSASVTGRDSVVWRQEGVVNEGCGGEEQKDEAVVEHQAKTYYALMECLF